MPGSGSGFGSSARPALLGALPRIVLLARIIAVIVVVGRLLRALRPTTSTATATPDRAVHETSTRQTGNGFESRPRGYTIRGETGPEFDRVTLPSLRAWLKFWKDENRSAGRAEEMARENPQRYAGRTREDHISMIEAEIVAREQRRSERRRASRSQTP